MNHSKGRRVASGKYGICGSSFVSLMNIVMQLRKVCNHPDLCEPRSVLTSCSARFVIWNSPDAVWTYLFAWHLVLRGGCQVHLLYDHTACIGISCT